MASDAFEKFLQSMSIAYMEWQDGIGYDLLALAALPPEELVAAEDLLVARHAADWRDLEALVCANQLALAEYMSDLSEKSHSAR